MSTTTTIHELPAAWRADPEANAEGCARQLEEMLSSMQGPAEIRTPDHPEANGRKPQFGEQEYVFGFIDEDGRPFSVRMGAEGWRNHSQHVLDMLTEAPSYNDCSLETRNALASQLAKVTAERDFCRNTLLNAGWTHQEGAQAWKPPVNLEAGKTWRKLIETEKELAAALKAVKDLAGQLTQRERQLAQTTTELNETQAMLSKEQRRRIEAEERPQAERKQLRLDVAELTGRLKERQMVAHEQEKGLLEQVRGMRTVADEALVLLETLSDYFDSTAERKGGKWWEWKESARRLRDQIASWRLRLNARPTRTDLEGGAA